MLSGKQHWSNSSMESPEKHFGDSHIRGCEQQWQDLLGQKQRPAPRYPCLIQDQEVQFPLPAELPPLGLRQHLHLSVQEGQDPEVQNFTLFHFPICTSTAKAWWRPGHGWQCAWACMAAETRAHKEAISWPLLALIIFPWAWERGLSFKLTNLFPNSLWACAVPSPYPIPLLILRGSLPYWMLSWFSQATLLPFMWAFWLLLHISQRRNFSLTGSPSPASLWGWTGRPPGSSVLSSSRIPSIWPAMGQSPGESGSCISDLIRLNVWCNFAPFIAN